MEQGSPHRTKGLDEKPGFRLVSILAVQAYQVTASPRRSLCLETSRSGVYLPRIVPAVWKSWFEASVSASRLHASCSMKATASDGIVRSGCFCGNSWCFPGDPTENTPYSRAILSRLAIDDAVVPEIWAFEIANSIYVSYNRRKRITDQQIREYPSLLKALPISVEPQSIVENIDLESLARRRDMAAYDAAYLNLAKRTKLPLATSDAPLRDAAS
jgi:predicted nucleic acid-binding protein